MKLIDNRFTRAKNGRWYALGLYLAGIICINVGGWIHGSWSIYLMELGLVLWIYPVFWVAYKFVKEGF